MIRLQVAFSGKYLLRGHLLVNMALAGIALQRTRMYTTMSSDQVARTALPIQSESSAMRGP
jgi:hypothetical protein